MSEHMAEEFPLVSIVTPVYNGAAFLGECIESVLRQTYPLWEYVIVNNHSSDGSLAIAERYAVRDERIRVLSTPAFLPAVDSQNFALRQISAASKYCKIVHADDWIFPECVARMVDVAEAYPSVGVVSAYRLTGDVVTLDGLPYPSTFVPGRQIARSSLLSGLYVFGSPTSLLLRSEIVRARPDFYSERQPWTDMDVCYEILKRWDFGFVHQVLTFTRRHEAAGTAVTARLRAHLLGRLVLLERHGPYFLTEAELRGQRAAVLERHQRFLLRCLVKGWDKDIWDYHIRGLAMAGHPVQLRTLVLNEVGALFAGFVRRAASIARRSLTLIRERIFRRSSAARPSQSGRSDL
jgi:glycosyltransferase involved in cell wall biosynthesis